MPILGQEPEHRARRNQMPRDRLDITKLMLPIITTLHAINASQPKSGPPRRHAFVQQTPNEASPLTAEGGAGLGGRVRYLSRIWRT